MTGIALSNRVEAASSRLFCLGIHAIHWKDFDSRPLRSSRQARKEGFYKL